MDWTLNTFSLIISFNSLRWLLGWPESLLINSLSLLHTDVAALPPHSYQRRTIFSYLYNLIFGVWLGTGLLICAIPRVLHKASAVPGSLHHHASLLVQMPLPFWRNPSFCSLSTLQPIYFWLPGCNRTLKIHISMFIDMGPPLSFL